jgi:aspartyl-tRNA(Asn)/glutamyl-tRNA(Gln) amidotransferase subunit A
MTLTEPVAERTVFELGVSEVADAAASGRLTPLEIAEELLSRIERYDDLVRAFSQLERDRVLADAQKLTEEAAAGRFRGPLHGVPFGVKEQFRVEGLPTRTEWRDTSPEPATYTATAITRLTDAGALFLGKLFMVGQNGSGTPPTRNPWNLEATPGGSSSGSGAAVGARFMPFALSEQTSGSGIRPAAYCGVSGFKPTYGRNPRDGMVQLAYSFDHACIIATTIADAAKVFTSISGADPKDPSSVGGPAVLEPPLPAPPRIGVIRNVFPELIEPGMNAAIDAAVERLTAAGAEVVDFLLPDEFETVYPLSFVVRAPEDAVIHLRTEEKVATMGFTHDSRTISRSQSKFGGRSRGVAPFVPATYYVQAQRVRRWLADRIDASMAGFDAILTATAPGAAPFDLSYSGDATLLSPFSSLGQPAAGIPAGLDSSGMPLGLQLIGPRMSDEHLLATSVWCEDVLGRLPIPAMDW